jgi:fimbrial isopeptide formation D2 family protein/LPXTG-motif cell wall-anchored protein
MKKNVLKKFAAAALAAATVMSSMSVMAFAADTETAASTGSVTITKYEGSSQGYEELETNYGAVQSSVTGEKLNDVKFAYIEVGDREQVDVEDSTNKITTTEMLYKLTDAAVTALELTTADVTENGTNYYRMATLDTAIQKHKNAAIDLVKKTTENHAKPTKDDGTVKFTDLSLEKLYLFAETDASAAKKVSDGSAVAVTKVSVPFFVSLPFTDASGKSVTDIYAYPKNSTGNVNIDKEIESVGTTTINGKQANANIGDEITYKVTYSVPVPENGLTELKIVDTMDKGLTFTNEASNITVKDDKGVDGTEKTLIYATDYEVTLDTTSNKVTIDFAKYLDSLQKNSTEEFTITYKVKLNESAVLGQTGNKNDVALVYKNYGETDSKTKTPDPGKEVKVFTYGIDLLKKGEGTNTVLKEVEFKLTDGNNEIKVKQSGNAYYPSKDADASSTVTTDNDGKIYIRGLKPGTYKLTETKTNAGYVLLKDPVVIVITPSTDANEAAEGVVSAYVGGKKVTMNADNGSDTAIVPLTVVNSKGFDLPATGGRGIALFTIAGIAIVAAAGSLLFMRKRSK